MQRLKRKAALRYWCRANERGTQGLIPKVINPDQAYKKLIDISLALSGEMDIQHLLQEILNAAKLLTSADHGVIYLLENETELWPRIFTEDKQGCIRGGIRGGVESDQIPPAKVTMFDDLGKENHQDLVAKSVHLGQTLKFEGRVDGQLDGVFEAFDYQPNNLLIVPLRSYSGKSLGVLALIDARNSEQRLVGFDEDSERFVCALCAQTSLVLDNQNFVTKQKRLESELEQTKSGRTVELEKALSGLSEAHILLKEITTTDPVTGIRNRQYFDDVFGQEWRRAERQQHALTLFLIDIDHFKHVNDTYGHPAGDICLTKVAKAIDGLFNRPSDVIARYGGEEFAVVLPYVEEEKAAQKAEQVRSHIEHLVVQVEGHEIRVTISIGRITAVPGKGLQQHELVAGADRALYQAKSAGRNTIRAGSIETND